MKKCFILLLVSTICVLSLFGCATKYNSDDFLGKTSAEIIKEYGDFDCITANADEDGLYRNCRCGYTIAESKAGFFGASDEVLFFIQFDESGIAIKCEEGYRPGG